MDLEIKIRKYQGGCVYGSFCELDDNNQQPGVEYSAGDPVYAGRYLFYHPL